MTGAQTLQLLAQLFAQLGLMAKLWPQACAAGSIFFKSLARPNYGLKRQTLTDNHTIGVATRCDHGYGYSAPSVLAEPMPPSHVRRYPYECQSSIGQMSGQGKRKNSKRSHTKAGHTP